MSQQTIRFYRSNEAFSKVDCLMPEPNKEFLSILSLQVKNNTKELSDDNFNYYNSGSGIL
jgi:hypothetical protein